jgi:putative membrane protein
MPYSKINPNDMILRDHLAYDRTVLANERTFLSYVRTAIALLASGGTLVKLFTDEQPMVLLGVALLILGGLVAVVGIWRYIRVARHIAVAYKELEE